MTENTIQKKNLKSILASVGITSAVWAAVLVTAVASGATRPAESVASDGGAEVAAVAADAVAAADDSSDAVGTSATWRYARREGTVYMQWSEEESLLEVWDIDEEDHSVWMNRYTCSERESGGMGVIEKRDDGYSRITWGGDAEAVAYDLPGVIRMDNIELIHAEKSVPHSSEAVHEMEDSCKAAGWDVTDWGGSLTTTRI